MRPRDNAWISPIRVLRDPFSWTAFLNRQYLVVVPQNHHVAASNASTMAKRILEEQVGLSNGYFP